jgi:hypothetical protein
MPDKLHPVFACRPRPRAGANRPPKAQVDSRALSGYFPA